MLLFILLLLSFNVYSQEDDFFENLGSPIVSDSEAYPVCNEKNQETILSNLAELPLIENGIHIGWSIEFNYKIIALRKSKAAIICDRSSKVFDFYHEFQKNLLEIEYEDFSHKYPEFFWVKEEDFQYLKQMYQENRIYHVCLDLMDNEGKFEKLSEWIKENNYIIDTIYVSNVLDWISKGAGKQDHWKKPYRVTYFNNLNKLMNEKTAFIFCSYHRGMKLRMSVGHTVEEAYATK